MEKNGEKAPRSRHWITSAFDKNDGPVPLHTQCRFKPSAASNPVPLQTGTVIKPSGVLESSGVQTFVLRD